MTKDTFNKIGTSDEKPCRHSGECCIFSDVLVVGGSRNYELTETGLMANPQDPIHFFSCQKSKLDSTPAIVTWSLLEDVFGYDAIKNNDIPSDCLIKDTPITPKVSAQPKTDPTHEQRVVLDALDDAHGDTSVAAKKLGISEKALRRKMKDNHIQLKNH